MFQQLFDYIYGVYQKGLPFVVYKKPLANEISIQIQKNVNDNLTSEFDNNGFVFAPFDSNNASYFIPASESDLYTIPINKYDFQLIEANIANSPTDKTMHINKVQQCVEFIKSGNAKKVVLSRKQFVEKEKIDFETQLDAYLKLIQLYPEAMVYWWFHPSTGVWMGATPERLLTLDQEDFQTMSLAGTQLYHNNLVWKEKEKMEQELVTNYIQSRLETLIDDLKTGASFTKKAGHLAHICTEINGKIKSNKSLTEVINILHPTPAVCGTPKESAFQYILTHEGYDRKFYTGFLGAIQLDKKTELFVNLRCMEWVDNGINLYIGGGITEDSIAEKEWEETVNKSQVMAKVL